MKNAACEFRFFVVGEDRSELKTVSIVERKGVNSDVEGLELIAEALRGCGGVPIEFNGLAYIWACQEAFEAALQEAKLRRTLVNMGHGYGRFALKIKAA